MTLPLHDAEAGVVIGEVDEAVGGDEQVGRVDHGVDIRTRVHLVCRRWRHEVVEVSLYHLSCLKL